jgi:transposase
VLRHHFNWSRLSMAAALVCRPDGSQAALVFQIREGSYNTESLIAFLEDLHRHFGIEKITLIWDGLPAHRSRLMSAWIAAQRRWPTGQRLPGYAPGLNPVEQVWGNVKPAELASLCADTTGQAHAAARPA